MSEMDQRINELILKWANNPNGRWGDIVKDLEEYTLKVREEMRKALSEIKKAA
jgi:hypothetical protein